jgi:hypothetical protein
LLVDRVNNSFAIGGRLSWCIVVEDGTTSGSGIDNGLKTNPSHGIVSENIMTTTELFEHTSYRIGWGEGLKGLQGAIQESDHMHHLPPLRKISQKLVIRGHSEANVLNKRLMALRWMLLTSEVPGKTVYWLKNCNDNVRS